MNWRKRWPASLKITLSALALGIIAAGALLSVRERGQDTERELRRKAALYAALLAAQLQPVLAFDDRETAREVLASARIDPDIESLGLFRSDGSRLDGFGEPLAPWTLEPAEAQVRSSNQTLEALAPVAAREGKRGLVILRMSRGLIAMARQAAMAQTLGMVCAALAFALIAAWMIAGRLSRRLARVGTEAAAREQERLNALVVERTAALVASAERYRSLVENVDAVPLEWDLQQRRITYIAPQAAALFGVDLETLRGDGGIRQLCFPEDRARLESLLASIEHHRPSIGGAIDLRASTPDGRQLFLHVVLSARAAGAPLQSLLIDMSKQKRLELDLHQAQKLESVGRLASGVAHEINTPVQFVSDSVHFVREAVESYGKVIGRLGELEDAVRAGAPTESLATQARQVRESVNLDFLLQRVPRALDRSLEGLSRITSIVRSMKEFAHPDGGEATATDLNRAVESTLIIARNEYKYVADVETDLGELPPVVCCVGDVNQAVLNILVNAAHAIGDRVKAIGDKGRISVRTYREGGTAVIAIGDTGGGIPEDIRDRIFDPFFTTKEVGRGTGQGLAISRSVIVEKHAGKLTFETTTGKGTTFFIRLPINGRSDSKPALAADARAA